MSIFRTIALVLACLASLHLAGCAGGPKDRKIEFVYLALGASDATGVGAFPLTEGYVFLIKRELDRQIPGVFLINLGIPGARIDLIKEQVRLAKQLGMKADLVTLWTGANDLINGDDPKAFRRDLRFILETLREDISSTIVIANLPDLTRLPRFQRNPDPRVTFARISAYNVAIEQEAREVKASLVDLFEQPVREELVFDLDGFHPNDAGHREIAKQFLNVIQPKVAR